MNISTKHNIVTILIVSLILTASYAVLTYMSQNEIKDLNAQVFNLQTTTENLETQQIALESDAYDYCMLAMEISTFGSHMYIGDDTWFNDITDEYAFVPDMQKSCVNALDDFRAAVQSEQRQMLLETYKDSILPVTE